MKKRLLPICAMALLAVGYSSVASADTGTVTKEEAQVQQDKAKKEEAIKIQQKSDEEKKQAAQVQEKSDMAKKEEAIKAEKKSEEEKKRIAQEQLKNDMAKKEAAIKAEQKNEVAKKEVAKPVIQGEKLPNTASNNVAMMGLSACLVAVGTLFGLNRRNKIKA
ncbi:LPXTG cell wall anchor domain-containing protein [Bacillus cereus]|uniref:LPXTG cell wall anchor domain-containing protein n=1 Tax=Bacillus cereus TaxID=1396 RepID=A0AB34DD50_BACCE|nr:MULTISPECIES: LPXTG cell wall anchor domain-containing protein [Bacillus cereus group]KAB2499621.1 LPXTG cell wall anchor domain-containing protein [Bacillus cereus]MCB5895642.1 LPXTG cell wall anchor domain-containing protein [Bacillus cereus]MCH5457990.1 LPXTG cell wall anchor domain-containing protein [Bacillus cereus]MCU5023015.1 LPXTG cell wall anchor domain-containing protein [Bacillus cereus]MDA1971902.1 LPXTG cell wall anchor domain-containing protein [Bacillus cereus]